MDRLIQYPAQIPLVEDMLNAQRNAMVGIGHLAGAAFGANTVAASGFACAPGEGLALTLAPGALLAPGVVDASAYGTLAAVSSALVRQFISRDPVTLDVSAAGATYIVSVAPQTVDTDDTVLPFYNAADPSVTYAGEGNSGLAAPTVRRDEAALSIGASVPEGSYPLWQIVVPAGATAITADMIAVASGAPFYPSLAAVAPRIVAPFNGQLAEAIGGYPLNAVVADPTTPGTFWVSTADANVSVPGATGATWQSLFNGYATQAWAQGIFATIAQLEAETTRATTIESNLQSSKVNRAGDTMKGTLQTSGNLLAGVNGGWSGGTATGTGRWVNGHIGFGAPDGNASAFAGFLQITDLVGNAAADYSGMNLFGFNYAGTRSDFTFAWNGNIITPKGTVAFTSELPTAGTIPGGTYTKTPMNDGTGRSVLRQAFVVSATDGTGVTFFTAFSSLPIIQMTALHDNSSVASVIANVSSGSLTNAGVVIDLRSLDGGGGQGTSSEGYTSSTSVYITVEGIVS